MAATKPTTSDCCRKHERENNELKDLLISMKLSVNILENIKRLSNDCIDTMESVALSFKRQDATYANQLENFQTTLDNIKMDLCYWNKKYESKILFDQTCGNDDKITSIFSTTTHNNNGNDRNECESNGAMQSKPPVANPSEATGHGQDSSEDVGINIVPVSDNHDHHDHDHGQHNDDNDNGGDQNSSEHSKSNGECPLIKSEPSSDEEEMECANDPNYDEDDEEEDENYADDDRNVQRNGSNNGLRGGDKLLPTDFCEISLDTTSQDFPQNGINGRFDNGEMSNLHDNNPKNDHSKGGAETMALLISNKPNAKNPVKWIRLVNYEKSIDQSLSQTTEKSSSDGGAHSSSHHHSSTSTSFNSIHSKSTSMDQASMVDSNLHLTSKFYTKSLNPHTTTPKIHGPMFLCDHNGCEFHTNTRQRLSMHKRTHAGEILYHCDVDGCDYISNYKGNIKIHKKHRHRFGSAATGTGCGGQTSAHNPYLEPGSNQDMAMMISDDSQQSQPNGRQESSSSSLKMVANYHQNSNNGDDEEEGLEDNGAAAVVESSASDSSRMMMDNNRSTKTRGRKRSYSCSYRQTRENNMDNENVSMSSADLEPPAKADTTKEQTIKEYLCKVDGCNYRTKWKQCLTAHEFLHAGIKPYKCDYPGCEYRTNFKSNVNVHKRQHSGTTSLFHCDLSGCGFSTPWKSSLLTHIRNHQHQQQPQQTSILAHSVETKQQPSTKDMAATTNPCPKPTKRQSSNKSDDLTTDNLILDDQNEDQQQQQMIGEIFSENQNKLTPKNKRNRIYCLTKTGK